METVPAIPARSSLYDRSDLESMFLPVGQMLQIDRVCEIEGNRLVCEVDIARHWVFPMHFPGDPIFPGTLLIEAAGQAVATWAWHQGFRGRPRLCKLSARFESPVLPQDRVVKLTVTVRNRKRFFTGIVEALVEDRKVAWIEPTVIILSQLELTLHQPASERPEAYEPFRDVPKTGQVLPDSPSFGT